MKRRDSLAVVGEQVGATGLQEAEVIRVFRERRVALIRLVSSSQTVQMSLNHIDPGVLANGRGKLLVYLGDKGVIYPVSSRPNRTTQPVATLSDRLGGTKWKVLNADGGEVASIGSHGVFECSGGIVAGGGIWRYNSFVFNFMGTDYNTKAKCNAVGLRFSDSDTPFPDKLVANYLSGTWSHVTDQGWQPSVTPTVGKYDGPAIIFPLARPYNWEADVEFYFDVGSVGDKGLADVGYITAENTLGAESTAYDSNGAATELIYILETNDGAGGFVNRLTSAAQAGTGVRNIKIKIENGCTSCWDGQLDAWFNYTGRQTGNGVSYSPSYGVIQFRCWLAAVFPTFYLRKLTVNYFM